MVSRRGVAGGGELRELPGREREVSEGLVFIGGVPTHITIHVVLFHLAVQQARARPEQPREGLPVDTHHLAALLRHDAGAPRHVLHQSDLPKVVPALVPHYALLLAAMQLRLLLRDCLALEHDEKVIGPRVALADDVVAIPVAR